jgi:hypothetical protein
MFGERCTVVKVPKSGGVCFSTRNSKRWTDSADRSSSLISPSGNEFKLANSTLICTGRPSLPPQAWHLISWGMKYSQRGACHPLPLSSCSMTFQYTALEKVRVSSLLLCSLFSLLSEVMAPSSALPIGATRVVSEMQPLHIDPSAPGSGLLNGVLAVLAPPVEDETERYDEEILDLHVVGFVVM